MNTLLALDRYTARSSSSSTSPSHSRRSSSSIRRNSPDAIQAATTPCIPPSPTRPRGRLIRTLTPQPPATQSKTRPRPKRPSTRRRRRTRQKDVDLAQRKGWWGASLVGVDVLWGGLWRAIFGEDAVMKDVEAKDKKPSMSYKGKERAADTLLEKPPIPTEDGTASSSSSSDIETDPDTEDEWIDPVTRAPETPEELSDQLVGADPVPPDTPRGRLGAGVGREVTPPISFRLRSYSPTEDVVGASDIEGNNTQSTATQGSPSSILTNPSPPRNVKREDLPEDNTPIISSSTLTTTTSSKRKKLLPNPIGQPLLTPAYERPSAFDQVPTGISLTSFTSSSTFSSPHPSYSGSIFGGARTYTTDEKQRKQEHHRLEAFFHHQQARTPSITRMPTPFHLPKTLILDLDETLIHSTSRPMNVQSSGMGGGGGLLGVSLAGLFPGSGRRGGGGGRGEGHTVEVVLGGRSTLYHVYKRPFVDHFLKKVSSWYTLVIFTASMQEYADPVIDWLDGGRGLFGKKLYRESCSLQPNGSYTKDLSLVEDDLSRVCFMDNSPISYNWNKANALPIEGWTSDPNDEALLDMLPVLDSLRFTSDVRRVLGIRGF